MRKFIGICALLAACGGPPSAPSEPTQDISTAPVDPQSDAYVTFIGRTRGAHPDFGPPPYGIPCVGVSGQPRVPVTFVDYGRESDAGFRGETGARWMRDGTTRSSIRPSRASPLPPWT